MSSSYAPGESIGITTSTEQLADEIGLTAENLAWRKEFLNFDEEDAQRLAAMAPVIEDRREPLIDAFLEPIYAHDRTQEILSRSPRGDKELRMIVDGYLKSLTGGQYDRSYFEHRTRIGQLHDRLDMPMYYFVGMFANLHEIVLNELRTLTVDGLADAVEDDETREAVVSELDETFANAMAAIRMTNLDLQVITDTYLHSYSEGMREEIAASKRMREEIGDTVVGLRRTSDEVEQSALDVDTLAGEQSESTEEIAGEVSNLSAMVEEVAASATQVEQRSSESQRLAEDGAESAEDAITVMRELDRAQRNIATEFEDLQAALDEIDEVVTVINGIADQTNLLALNASIEAARAGEAGAGFAVVADEVKSLAEESKVKVGEIEDLTERITENTDETADSLETGSERMENGIDRVEDAMENLEEIVTSIRETSQGIEEVAAATNEQASSTEEVAGMVDENARRADEIAEAIDRITQGIEAQSRTASEIDESLSALETETIERSQ